MGSSLSICYAVFSGTANLTGFTSSNFAALDSPPPPPPMFNFSSSVFYQSNQCTISNPVRPIVSISKPYPINSSRITVSEFKLLGNLTSPYLSESALSFSKLGGNATLVSNFELYNYSSSINSNISKVWYLAPTSAFGNYPVGGGLAVRGTQYIPLNFYLYFPNVFKIGNATSDAFAVNATATSSTFSVIESQDNAIVSGLGSDTYSQSTVDTPLKFTGSNSTKYLTEPMNLTVETTLPASDLYVSNLSYINFASAWVNFYYQANSSREIMGLNVQGKNISLINRSTSHVKLNLTDSRVLFGSWNASTKTIALTFPVKVYYALNSTGYTSSENISTRAAIVPTKFNVSYSQRSNFFSGQLKQPKYNSTYGLVRFNTSIAYIPSGTNDGFLNYSYNSTSQKFYASDTNLPWTYNLNVPMNDTFYTTINNAPNPTLIYEINKTNYSENTANQILLPNIKAGSNLTFHVVFYYNGAWHRSGLFTAHTPLLDPCYPTTAFSFINNIDYNATTGEINGTITCQNGLACGTGTPGTSTPSSSSGGSSSTLPPVPLNQLILDWGIYGAILAAGAFGVFKYGMDEHSRENRAMITMIVVMMLVAMSVAYAFGFFAPLVWMYFLTLFIGILGLGVVFVGIPPSAKV